MSHSDKASETSMVEELTKALVHTVEYVGPNLLPAVEGWSWYDALKKVSPDHLLLTEHKPVDAMD